MYVFVDIFAQQLLVSSCGPCTGWCLAGRRAVCGQCLGSGPTYLASNFPTAYVRVASQTYGLQHTYCDHLHIYVVTGDLCVLLNTIHIARKINLPLLLVTEKGVHSSALSSASSSAEASSSVTFFLGRPRPFPVPPEVCIQIIYGR